MKMKTIAKRDVYFILKFHAANMVNKATKKNQEQKNGVNHWHWIAERLTEVPEGQDSLFLTRTKNCPVQSVCPAPWKNTFPAR